MKTLPFALILVLGISSPGAWAQNLLRGDFATGKAGSPPPAPWLSTKPTGASDSPIVQLATLPGSTDDKLWVRLHDPDPNLPAKLLQVVPPVHEGKLSLKLYFSTIGKSFRIYLGTEKVMNANSRVIDLKVVSKGRVRIGGADEVRESTGFIFKTGTVYDLTLTFAPAAEKGKMDVTITAAHADQPLYSGTVDSGGPVECLRLSTDSNDITTDAYVTDIQLDAQ